MATYEDIHANLKHICRKIPYFYYIHTIYTYYKLTKVSACEDRENTTTAHKCVYRCTHLCNRKAQTARTIKNLIYCTGKITFILFSGLQTCILSIFPNNYVSCDFRTSFILSKGVRLQKGWNKCTLLRLQSNLKHRLGRACARRMLSIIAYATTKNSGGREERRKAVNRPSR